MKVLIFVTRLYNYFCSLGLHFSLDNRSNNTLCNISLGCKLDFVLIKRIDFNKCGNGQGFLLYYRLNSLDTASLKIKIYKKAPEVIIQLMKQCVRKTLGTTIQFTDSPLLRQC